MFFKSTFIFIFLIFYSLLSFTQNQNIDSLYQIIQNETLDNKTYLITKIDIANYFVYTDLDSAEHYINQVFDDLEMQEYEKALPENYHKHYLVKAWFHQGKDELYKAKKYMKKAYEISSKLDDIDKNREVQINLASLLVMLREDSALYFIEELLTEIDTSKSKNEKFAWLMGQHMMSRAYANQGNYNKTIQIIISALKNPIVDELKERKGFLNAMGVHLQGIRDYDTAKKYLAEALSLPNLFDWEKKCYLEIWWNYF